MSARYPMKRSVIPSQLMMHRSLFIFSVSHRISLSNSDFDPCPVINCHRGRSHLCLSFMLIRPGNIFFRHKTSKIYHWWQWQIVGCSSSFFLTNLFSFCGQHFLKSNLSEMTWKETEKAISIKRRFSSSTYTEWKMQI